MTPADEEKDDPKVVEAAPKDIPDRERLKLWVASGGRCAICNEYLLQNEFTGHYVNVGEMAHNVGRQKAEGSARGFADLDISVRNKAENLLLLCDRDHKTIDNRETRDDWPVERLAEIKRVHEDRIHYVTGLRENAETVVLRVIGEVQGAGAVEVSPQTVIGAVRPNGLYPRYKLGPGGERDIELDLRRLPAEGSDGYWDLARQAIDDIGRQLADGVRRNLVRHLSVFAFARIPLLVLLGDRLDDKIYAELYQRQRDERIGWGWDSEAEPVAFDVAQRQAGEDATRVTLICSVSGSVQIDQLPAEIVEGAYVYELAPVGVDPHPSVLLSKESLIDFTSTYRQFLARCEIDHPDAETLAVVPAVPLTAAIELGRARMRSKHPALRVYDRADGEYRFAVEVSS